MLLMQLDRTVEEIVEIVEPVPISYISTPIATP